MQLTLSLRAANWTFGRAEDASALRRAGRMALAGFVAVAAAAPATADAGTYGVHACRFGDTGPHGTAPAAAGSDWRAYARTTGSGETRYLDRCGAGDGASFHWEAGRNYRDNDEAGYQLQEKPGLQLRTVTWHGSASGLGGTQVSVQATTSDGSTPTLMDPRRATTSRATCASGASRRPRARCACACAAARTTATWARAATRV